VGLHATLRLRPVVGVALVASLIGLIFAWHNGGRANASPAVIAIEDPTTLVPFPLTAHDPNRLEVLMKDGTRVVASRMGTQALRARFK